jgi:Family of unknown function (DUF6338)
VSEIFKVFEPASGVTIQQVLGFAALVLPGFVSLRVYDTLRGGERRQAKDLLIDIFIYSIASDAIVYGATTALWRFVTPALRVAVTSVVAGCLFVITPVALAVAFFVFQRAMMRWGVFPDTFTSSWNHAMNRVSARCAHLGAIVTFHDGRRIGARIGQSLQQAPGIDDLLLDEVWTLDGKGVTLVERSPASHGLLIRRTDCQSIEFVGLEPPRRHHRER